MNPETKQYLERVITRLEDIATGPPFKIRPRLLEFIGKLKEVTSV